MALATVLNIVDPLDFTPNKRQRFGHTLLDRIVQGATSKEVGAAQEDLHRVFEQWSHKVMCRTSYNKRERSVHSGANFRTSPV